MAQLPMEDAVQRFKENEERIDVFVNESDTTDVVPRTGSTYPTLRKAVKQLFENGGLPAEPFETKAQMTSEGASLPDGQLAIVHNDTADNGLYVKTAGAWVKSKYDKADTVSPSLQGTPTAPTAPLFSKDTTIANTSFVNRAVEGATTNSTGINLAGYSESEYIVTEEQYRRNFLNVYGTPSVDEVTLVVPDAPQRYLWVNNTSTKSLKIKTTSMQSSVEVSKGIQTYMMMGSTLAKAYEQKADINSPKLLGTPTAPTPPITSNDGTISTTKFVQDLVGGKFSNYVAGINLSGAVGDVELTEHQLNSAILNIYGTPAEPVNLVFPDDTNKTYLVRMSGLPTSVINVKLATKSFTERLGSGAYHLTISSLGFTIPYDRKANIQSPELFGTPTAPTPTRDVRGKDIATTLFVGNVAQGVIVENITDDSTEISNSSGHTICLTGTLTKDVTLTIIAANISHDIGINIDNMTDGGKSVFIRGRGQNSSATYIELKPKEGKSIYTRVGVAYSLDNQSSSLPVTPASKTSLGVVKIGSGINVDSSGTISATGSGGGSGANLSYSGKFRVGGDYNVGDVVEHGSGVYQVVSNVTNAQKPYDDVSFQKIAHNYQAGEKGSVTVLSNDYEVLESSASRVVYMTKDGLLVFNSGSPNLRVSRDYGKSWESQSVLTLPSGSWTRWVRETSDGELFVGASELDGENPQKFKIYKSTGWDSITGLAPEWDVVFEIQRTGANIADWGISIHNNYIVMAEYGTQKGRDGSGVEEYAKYAYLSKDHGKTWETIFNLDDHVTTLSVHMHGACFDPYWNRIWVSHGDGAYNGALGLGTNGLYYSDDFGKTWVSALQTSGAGNNFPQSVGIVALPTCILFSSDSPPNGVQRIDRAQGRIPHKGYYEVESAYYIPEQVEGSLTNILSTGKKAEWLPNAPYIWSFAAESNAGKTGCVVSWDGWEFHELWLSEGDYSPSTGAKHIVGVTPENTLIITGDGEGVGGDNSVKWRRTIKVSFDV